jgi:TRAP-type C4-dicarboxylate transport system permease small subunit
MKLLEFLADMAGFLAALAAVALALLGTADVLSMMLLNRPIVGTVEFSSVLLVCVLFLGIAGAVRDGDNISVDILLNALGPRARRAVERFNGFCTLVFFVMLTYLSWKLALHSLDKGDVMSGAVNFHLWPFKLIAALGATLALIALVVQLLTPKQEDE